MFKNIFSIIFVSLIFCSPVFSQTPLAPVSEQLMANQIGAFLLYNSDGKGVENINNTADNSIGGGYVAIYSTKAGRLNFTLANFGSVEESSVTPVGGRQFTQDTELRIPLDLTFPFGMESSKVYLHGGARFLWQNGGAENPSKFTASPGFGVGFKIPSAIGDSYTGYTYVPRINDSNSLQEHRVYYELYRTLADNPKYRFFSRVTASTGRFDPVPMAINFTSGPMPYYNVRLAIGITRQY